MTEKTRPGFLANYKIVRSGPARPAFGPARLTPLVYTVFTYEGSIQVYCIFTYEGCIYCIYDEGFTIV